MWRTNEREISLGAVSNYLCFIVPCWKYIPADKTRDGNKKQKDSKHQKMRKEEEVSEQHLSVEYYLVK